MGPEEQYEHVAQFKDGQEVHHYHDQEHHDEHGFYMKLYLSPGCWNSLPGRMGSSHYLHCFRIQEDKISVQRLVCV